MFLSFNKAKLTDPAKLAKIVETYLTKLAVPGLSVQVNGHKVQVYMMGLLALELERTKRGWAMHSSLDLKMQVSIDLVVMLTKLGYKLTYGRPFVVDEVGAVIDSPDAEVYVLMRSANEAGALYPQPEGGH